VELLFIRHGEPAWETDDGAALVDPGLTELGHRQAALLAERFRGTQIDELVVSPLVRAQETAAPIADALGVAPTTEDWLAEIGAPAWDGTPNEQVQRIFSEQRTKSVAELWDGLPGGETFRDFHQRITTGAEGFLQARGVVQASPEPPLWQVPEPEKRVMLVAHAGTNATAIGWLLGIPPVPWEWERFVSLHASVSVLRPAEMGGARAYSLSRFGDIEHLPADHRTGDPP
jgi:broad specificity phosphatase PhoE